MSLLIVIEVLDDDGRPVPDHARDFDIAQLKLAELDRQNDGYVHLDTQEYLFPARIVGVVADGHMPGCIAVKPIEEAL